MTKDVIISISGFHENDDMDGGTIELVTDGQYGMDEGFATFSYMESELTGMEGTKTTFEVHDSSVIMRREGTVNSLMTFEEGNKHLFMYEIPFGTMTMGVDTHSIYARFGDKGGDLNIKYVVDMNNTIVSRNEFKINVREV